MKALAEMEEQAHSFVEPGYTSGTWRFGGSGVVLRGVPSRTSVVIIHIRGLITRLKTTHEPPCGV